ncbi:MAG: hypothetical protein KatS3mg110_1037 [Pirellulaceae bacterium]|nr:MAG: hypothetical protein KatS3mg110_1037 [Pirellulaceae bacterium]
MRRLLRKTVPLELRIVLFVGQHCGQPELACICEEPGFHAAARIRLVLGFV